MIIFFTFFLLAKFFSKNMTIHNCNFKEYIHFLDSLIDEFDTRFTCFEKLRIELILFENPLAISIEGQHIDLQDELCDLQNDISLKTVKETANFYKVFKKSLYPKLRNFGLRIHSMFGSTYLCQTSFPKMKFIKDERRSSLMNLCLILYGSLCVICKSMFLILPIKDSKNQNKYFSFHFVCV